MGAPRWDTSGSVYYLPEQCCTTVAGQQQFMRAQMSHQCIPAHLPGYSCPSTLCHCSTVVSSTCYQNKAMWPACS